MHELTLNAGLVQPRTSYRLLHEMPGRCRIRVARLRVDAAVREGVSHRLANSPLVSSFRLNPACESVTIEYLGQGDALFDMLLPPCLMPAVLPARQVQKIDGVKNQPNPFRAMAWAATALVLGPAGGFGLDLVLILLTGLPIWRCAVITLVKERRLNVDFLDGLALAIAVLRREPRTAALMAMMVHLGDCGAGVDRAPIQRPHSRVAGLSNRAG